MGGTPSASARPPHEDERPLLHPSLARLDPLAGAENTPTSRRRDRSLPGRLRLIVSTVGACLTLTFAGHAVGTAPPGVARATGVARLSLVDATAWQDAASGERDTS